MKYSAIVVFIFLCLGCKASLNGLNANIKELWLNDTATYLVNEFKLSDIDADRVLDATVFSGYYDAETNTMYHWELVEVK